MHFDIDTHMDIRWRGVGGRTVQTVLLRDIRVVKEFAPNIVVLQLGTNDLARYPAEKVGSLLEELAVILHDHYGVSVICVCQTIRRENEGHCAPNVYLKALVTVIYA